MVALKAQVSAEMILLLVVLLAVVALVASNLMTTSEKAGETFTNSSNKIIEGASNTCVMDEQCQEGEKCINGICKEE